MRTNPPALKRLQAYMQALVPAQQGVTMIPHIMNYTAHCLDTDRVIEVEMHSAQRSWQSTPGQLLKKAAQATPEGLLRLFVLVHNAPVDTVRDESTFFCQNGGDFPQMINRTM